MKCRFCQAELTNTFIDLVNSPASNSFISESEMNGPEIFYPLKVFVCNSCFLVQLDEVKKSDHIFNDEYVYFSSYSKTWLDHAKAYTELMIDRFNFSKGSRVIEIASNDGYLLQYFLEKEIEVLGIEPTGNTAKVAMNKGIDTIVDFFGVKLASSLAEAGRKADLLLGNNVLAHVPDILDFVGGMKILLNEKGIITMEFPHLMQLVENNQFDTIYHEHFSYLSFTIVRKIFASQGLDLFDVEELTTHGGSLRIFGKHREDNSKKITEAVEVLIAKEKQKGMLKLHYYQNFSQKAFKVKLDLLSFLCKCKADGHRVAAYGAAAKGNTLLNYCGIKNDMVDFVVDANPHKQNKFLPASHIPVVEEDYLKNSKPDYIIVLPWNLKDEIVSQLSYIRDWGGKFIVPIPHLQIL